MGKQTTKKTNVQVLLDDSISQKAKEKAQFYGFDSLAGMVRYLITNVVNEQLVPTQLTPMYVEQASPELEKEIEKGMKDYENGDYATLNSKEEIDAYFDSLDKD